MHGYMNDSAEDGENAVWGFHALFKFDILIPEGMGEEVKPNALCSAVE